MKAKLFTSTLLVGLLLLAGCSGPDKPGEDGKPNSSSSEIVKPEETSKDETSTTVPNKEVFEVKFVNWNGEVLFVDKVEEGETAVYEGPTPTKPSDAEFRYTFSGWDKKLENVKRNFSTNAQFLRQAISIDENYDESAAKWSKPGHLYFHYRRPTAVSSDEYNDWALWLWNKSPDDSEGTLWGASMPSVQEKFYEMSTSWETSIGGSGHAEDQAGRMLDIDLHKDGLVSGKSGNPVKLHNADTLGFLIVKQDSMDGGTHWTSDGGANTYIKGFQEELAKKGYVHVYCVQGNVGEYTFSYSSDIKENPVVSDNTGKYRSEADVDSSKTDYGTSKTSSSFKQLGVGYQIFVASFRDSNGDGLGDIRGIIEALPYLQDLGVEVLWLTPIQESESYHGYDITDFYKVDPKFGTEADYRELLYKAHKSGMKVLMDFVVNHTSKNNVWFKKSQRAEIGHDEFGNEINYRNMYHWKMENDLVKKYDSVTKTYKEVKVQEHGDWYRDGESKYYYYGKFGSNMAELNYDCQATRDLVTSMALYWLGFGVDGFRLDAVKHIYMKDEVEDTGSDVVIKDTGSKTYYDEEKQEKVTVDFDYSSDLTKNVVFWKEFANRLKYVKPDCFLVGENYDGWGERVAPYYQALDSQFDFALFFHAARDGFCMPQSGAEALAGAHYNETYKRYASSESKQLGKPQDHGPMIEGGNRPDFINGAFTSNHDTARMINNINGTPIKNKDGYVVDSKAIDKVTGKGNEVNKAKVAAAITILNPGISWIYYGDELGMSGNTDKHIETYENENNMDLWYRQPFKWDDADAVTAPKFDKYQIQWDEYNKTILGAETQQNNSSNNDMFDLFKELIAVKKTYLKGAQLLNTSFNGQNEKMKSDLIQYTAKNSAGQTIKVYINTGSQYNTSFKISGHVVAHLNGAGADGTIPPFGVIVTK